MGDTTMTMLSHYDGIDRLGSVANLVWRAVLETAVDVEDFDRTLSGCWSTRDPDTWLPLDRAESSGHADRARLRLHTWAAVRGLAVPREIERAVDEMTYGRQLELLSAIGGRVLP